MRRRFRRATKKRKNRVLFPRRRYRLLDLHFPPPPRRPTCEMSYWPSKQRKEEKERFSASRESEESKRREERKHCIGIPNAKSGTLVQCRSQKFQKCVIYLSEICQKTVSFKNLSENHLNCVRYLSEMCQIQISVIILSEKFCKCLKYVSVAKKVSENCHGLIQKTVRNLS